MKTAFARVSGRDFSQKKAHISSSCSCCDMIKGDGSGSKYKQVLTYSCFFLLSFADIFLFHLFLTVLPLGCLWHYCQFHFWPKTRVCGS